MSQIRIFGKSFDSKGIIGGGIITEESSNIGGPMISLQMGEVELRIDT